MIKVISDSTCDLSQELLERFDVSIIPLHVVMGEKEYEDGVDITPDQIYAWADQNRTTPKTSAPSINRTMDIMRKYLKEGNELICFAISEEMSTSANVMRMAAQELEAGDRIHVINSANLSTGIGLLVLEAAQMARDGKSAEEIVSSIEKLIPRVRASFVVDTLTYLHRGGRCSGLAALAGSALKLHPRIDVVDGIMGAGKKYRGEISKAMVAYTKDMEEALRSAKSTRVFITHSGCNEETVEQVYSFLEGLNHFEEICVTRAGGVISSHCGYGTLGVLFIEGEK